MKRFLLVLLFGLPVLPLQAKALFNTEPDVRVRIINSLDALEIFCHGEWFLQYGDSSVTLLSGKPYLIVQTKDDISVQDSVTSILSSLTHFRLIAASDTSTLDIAHVPFGVGWWWGGQEDRNYEGQVNIYLDSAGDLCVTIQLPLEEYLKGVVPYEIGGTSPLEALKAQAVSARSEAVIALTSKLYSGERHDLTSDVECQVFSGNHKRTLLADQAVDQTQGLVISEKGQTINAYYASNCGGHAELIENVWPQRARPASYQVAYPDRSHRSPLNLHKNWHFRRWLKSSPKVNCNPAYESALPSWSQKNFRWKREFSTAEITDLLSPDSTYGEFKRMRVLKRGVSGRIISALLIFESGHLQVDGELALRQLFSPSLRSSAFIMKKRWGRFTLEGAGWGHGVGMCQSGAIAKASRGDNFQQILAHYYPKAELMSIYSAEKE